MATADLTSASPGGSSPASPRPLGIAEPSTAPYIAEIQRRLAAQDRVTYRLHAMGTSLEGATQDVLALVGELHAVPFGMGAPRVYTVLKLDDRRDRESTLDSKVASVDALLDQPSARSNAS
jgi:uncharacterized protein (TIGR00106 family)